MKETIAIIGHTGMVGSQVFRYFKEKGYKVMGLSGHKKTHNWEDINKEARFIFVCVPTPFNWKIQEANLLILDEVLSKLKNKIVIIKSTIPPGTTEQFQKKYSSLILLFNPEFLSNATAWEDFINPDRQLIGYTKQSYQHAMDILNMLPEAPYNALMTSTEAEVCKYINNFHGALMVIFANFFYDICQKVGADFERVKKAAQASKWVGSPMGRMYWEVFHGGYRGYRGKCFPKDIATLIKWCEKNGIKHEILRATRNVNVRILKTQGFEEYEKEVNSKVS